MSNSDEVNPFQSPLAETGPPKHLDTDAERLRKQHLSYEASMQSMGFLYYIGAIIFAIYFVLMLVGLIGGMIASTTSVDPILILQMVGVTSLCGAIAWIQLWVGRGLRRLDSRARVPAIVFSVIGLAGIPIGTLISAYFLWLLLSKKGKFVFSDEYHAIIADTPHIKYKTSIVVWVFLALLVLLLVFGLLSWVVTAR